MKMLTTEGIAFDSLTDTKMVSLASTNGVYCLSYFLKPEETRDKYKSQKCLFHRLRCYSWKGPCGPFCAFSVNGSRIQSVANLCEIQTFLENNTGTSMPVLGGLLLPKCFGKIQLPHCQRNTAYLCLLILGWMAKKPSSPFPFLTSCSPVCYSKTKWKHY